MMYGLLFASIVLSFQFTALGLVNATEDSAPVIDRAPINIVLLPFEILERGSTEVANAVPEKLTRLLRNDPKFAIVSADPQALGSNTKDQTTSLMSSVDFLIVGSVYAGAGGRRLLDWFLMVASTGDEMVTILIAHPNGGLYHGKY